MSRFLELLKATVQREVQWAETHLDDEAPTMFPGLDADGPHAARAPRDFAPTVPMGLQPRG